MSTNLEQRYRRLLLAYPASHRAAHGEEMLGVLLDAAGPRTRPGLADTADLLRGGFLVRIRRADAAGWGDALAVIGVVTSMLVATLAPIGLGLLLFSEYAPKAVCLALMGWPLAVAAGLVGLRRTAAALGIAATLALVATGSLSGLSGPWIGLAALAAAATGVTDARRGWRVLGWVRAVTLVAGCAFVSGFLLLWARVSANHWSSPYLPGPLEPHEQVWLLLGAGVVLVGAACFRVATSAGRRVTLVLAAPLTALTLGLLGFMPLFDGRVGAYANLSAAGRLGIVVAGLSLALLTVLARGSRRPTLRRTLG